ncbi:MAG: hypothetical protein JSS36_05880 [Proteobacteria bacterium]|nr:hypothetical protein [Pseudomonadota bacterium]
MIRLYRAAGAALALMLCALPAAPARADEAKGVPIRRCLLVVDGKTYINGPCIYYPMADGSFFGKGSFQIAERLPDKHDVMGYFAQVDIGKRFASVNWNAGPKSTHAQAFLGEDFKREGACWVNARAKVCAWK